MQVLFWQQPFGQLVALQAQVPLIHGRPGAHALPVVPQTQVPFEQLSAVVPQETHTAPPVPHALSEGVRHVLFRQQPFGQLAALHTQVPLTQT